jgi:pyrroloquinoline-quinone synthase
MKGGTAMSVVSGCTAGYSGCVQVFEQEEVVSSTLWDRIEQARARWNVLEHPFYVRWSEGTLSREELADYAGQYRHAVEAIATMTAQLAGAEPQRDELRSHAREEAAHVELWDGFVEAVGGDSAATPTSETEECVAIWTDSGSSLETMARLYAIESGQPEISRIKRAGLIERYGIDEGAGTAYFQIHEGRDAEHAAESRELLTELAGRGDEDALVAAAESAFKGNWRLLDGVEERSGHDG